MRALLIMIGASFVVFNVIHYYRKSPTTSLHSSGFEEEDKKQIRGKSIKLEDTNGFDINMIDQPADTKREKLIEELKKENMRLKELLSKNDKSIQNHERTESMNGLALSASQSGAQTTASLHEMRNSSYIALSIQEPLGKGMDTSRGVDLIKAETGKNENRREDNNSTLTIDSSSSVSKKVDEEEDEEGKILWTETFALKKRVEDALKWAASSTEHIDWSLIGKGEIHILYKLNRYLQHFVEDYRTPEMMKLRLHAGMQCSEDDASHQEAVMKTVSMDICSEIEWYKVAQLGLPSARTFIDIGANKGYLASLFISLWGGGGVDISPKKVFDYATELNLWKGSRNPAGFCKDGHNHGIALYCSSKRSKKGVCMDKNMDIKVFSIDGSSTITEQMNGLISKKIIHIATSQLGGTDESTIDVKSDVIPKLYDNSTFSNVPRFTKASVADDDTLPVKFKPSTVEYLTRDNESRNRKLYGTSNEANKNAKGNNTNIWGYWNYAMSDSVGKATFTKQGKDEKVGPGFGGGKINAKASNGYNVEEVDMTTVDNLVEILGIGSLDILKIDAEGHDNKVISGAMKVIEKKVSMFVFEGYGWLSGEMISKFNDLGYSCYSSSKAGLFKLDSNCLADDVISKKKEKGNVFCASRIRAPMVTLSFDGLSFPAMLVELHRMKEQTDSTRVKDNPSLNDEEFGKSFVSWKAFCKDWPQCALL